MNTHKPRVSIGLPVYNGENYLAETLDSILAQTFTDFELIISDNASTDRTADICREYAHRDHRITYYRNAENLGAARNYNRVFELSSGDYFKWAAHDDKYAPVYLQRCVDILEHDPRVVVAHTKTVYINEIGNELPPYDDLLEYLVASPSQRLRAYLFRPAVRYNAIFGLIRADILKKTPLIASYTLSDQVLLGELLLYGTVYRVPEFCFFRRSYPNTKTRSNRRQNKIYSIWMDPRNEFKWVLPRYLKASLEYLHAANRVPLSRYERNRCYLYIGQWHVRQLFWVPCERAYRLCTSPEKQKRLFRRLFLRSS